MDESLVRVLLQASFNEDPLFVATRRRHFDHHSWFDVPGLGLFQHTTYPFGPTTLPVLMSACGWDLRPTGFPEALNRQQADSLLDGARNEKKWLLLLLNSLTPAEVSVLSESLVHRGIRFFTRDFDIKVIEGCHSWGAYLQKQTKKFRTSFRRTTQAAKEAGVEYRYDLNWDDIVKVYRLRSVRMGESDYSQGPEFSNFLRELREVMKAHDRWFEVGAFKDGKMISFILGIWSGRVFHCYQVAHDPEFHSLRPGILVFYEAMRLVLDRGVEIFSFCGDQDYLKIFTSTVVKLQRMVIFRGNFLGKLVFHLWRLKSKLRGAGSD